MSCNDTNLEIRQGTTFQRLLIIEDGDEVPVDLTGYDFVGIAKLSYDETDAAFTFSFEIRDQTAFPGQVYWNLTASETTPLEITDNTIYIYNVLMIQPSTDPLNIIQGQIIVEPVITPAP